MSFTDFFTNASTGSNMNGGSDENTSPAYSATNGGWNSGTGVFTPTSGDPSAVSPTLVGQFAHVFTDGSTTPTRIARVTAVSSTTLTLSTTAGSGTAPTTAGTGISVNVGGVWKGPNGTVGFPFSGATLTSAATNASGDLPFINMKNGTNYAITAAITWSSANVSVGGYTSTVRDGGKAVIDGGTSGSSYVLLTVSGTPCEVMDLILQNNGATGSAAGLSNSNNRNTFRRVVVNSVRGAGFVNTFVGRFTQCEAYACNQSNTAATAGFNITAAAVLKRCVSHDNTGSNSSGFVITPTVPVTLIGCIADTNGQHGFSGTGIGPVVLQNCIASANTSDGARHADATCAWDVENCIFSTNGGYGFTSTANAGDELVNNAFRSNTSGQTNNTNADLVTGSVTLTGDPFTDAANGDFTLNNTSGAGASCRGAGIGTYTQTASSYAGTVGYPDIGIQHQETGGGGPVARQTIRTNIGTY